MTGLVYRTVTSARLTHRLVDEGAGPVVVLLHGFPECAHSWRHQIPALVHAGYRVVAPNQRGYAGTGAPTEIAAYDQLELAADVVALLDVLGVERARVIGHDWGAPVAWHTAVLHPDRVSAVGGLSVPWGGRTPEAPISILERRLGGGFFYMLYFQEPGVAEAELDGDVREMLRRFYWHASGDAPLGTFFVPQPRSAKLRDTMNVPPGLPPWLGEEDLDLYEATFRESGFRGPLHWYRNFDRTWERTAGMDLTIRQPALYVGGDRDPVLVFNRGARERMSSLVPGLRKQVILPGCGHWTQQERPAEVTAEILAFLRGL